jgi:hypothetical protein
VSDLLVVDVAFIGVMVLLAAVIIVRRGRSPKPSAPPQEVAELDSEGTAPVLVPVIPGLSDGVTGPDPSLNGLHRAAYEPDPGAYEPDPGAYEPDPGAYELDPAAREPDAGAREPDPAAREPDLAAREPDPGAREPAGLEQETSSQFSGVADAGPGAREPARLQQEAPSQVSHVANTVPGPRAPAAELNGRPGPDGAVTSGRVSSYYEGADQPMADYLADLGWDEESGWVEEPGARDPR